jgi:DNA-binding transcriptional regulator YdaS (Cro superfamily)
MPEEASSGGGGSSLPEEIVQSIAIANAKSIGEQPAILANLALANQILNQNLQHQTQIAQQQAFNQIAMATTARCVALITDKEGNVDTAKMMEELQKVMGGGDDPNSNITSEVKTETKTETTTSTKTDVKEDIKRE